MRIGDLSHPRPFRLVLLQVTYRRHLAISALATSAFANHCPATPSLRRNRLDIPGRLARRLLRRPCLPMVTLSSNSTTFNGIVKRGEVSSSRTARHQQHGVVAWRTSSITMMMATFEAVKMSAISGNAWCKRLIDLLDLEHTPWNNVGNLDVVWTYCKNAEVRCSSPWHTTKTSENEGC